VGAHCARASDHAPAWLRQAAAIATPSMESSVPALVLVDEAHVVLDEGGRITTTRRRAVRILTQKGRRVAVGRVIYTTDTRKVKRLHGFLVWPNGEVKKYGKKRTVDLEAAPHDVYNEVRVRAVSGADEAGPGVVFGFESVLEDRSVFTQFEWPFQDELPVVRSSFSLTLPPGWSAEGVVYNHAHQEPTLVGRSYRWELHDLPPIKDEPARPALTSIAPWLAVSLVPPPGGRAGIGRSFEGWPDVAHWLSQLADPQTAVTPDLESKAHGLTEGARSEYERIRAIARYTQSVKYVSIQMGIGRGGGYKPHAAAEVLAKGYGDCKDKANLMRTLLRLVGIESYPVAVFFGDRERVREDWPSPQQFNHAIIAVRLKEELEGAAIGTLPGLGRVLYFDPTDEHTPVGLLPQHEEGSLGLLVSAEHGTLLRLPVSAPEANRVERRLDVALANDGTLSGTVEELAFGHAAARYRRQQEEGAAGAYRRQMERLVARTGPGARMRHLEVTEAAEGAVRVAFQFTTPGYAQSVAGRLLIVRPRVLPGTNRIHLTDTSRTYPVVLDSESFEEHLRMKLPDGFAVDELPRSSQGQAPWGTRSSSCEASDNYLDCHRAVAVSASVVPVGQYKEVRRFFAWVNNAGSEPVVLSRQAHTASQ
jgi:hypothetical protein